MALGNAPNRIPLRPSFLQCFISAIASSTLVIGMTPMPMRRSGATAETQKPVEDALDYLLHQVGGIG